MKTKLSLTSFGLVFILVGVARTYGGCAACRAGGQGDCPHVNGTMTYQPNPYQRVQGGGLPPNLHGTEARDIGKGGNNAAIQQQWQVQQEAVRAENLRKIQQNQILINGIYQMGKQFERDAQERLERENAAAELRREREAAERESSEPTYQNQNYNSRPATYTPAPVYNQNANPVYRDQRSQSDRATFSPPSQPQLAKPLFDQPLSEFAKTESIPFTPQKAEPTIGSAYFDELTSQPGKDSAHWSDVRLTSIPETRANRALVSNTADDSAEAGSWMQESLSNDRARELLDDMKPGADPNEELKRQMGDLGLEAVDKAGVEYAKPLRGAVQAIIDSKENDNLALLAAENKIDPSMDSSVYEARQDEALKRLNDKTKETAQKYTPIIKGAYGADFQKGYETGQKIGEAATKFGDAFDELTNKKNIEPAASNDKPQVKSPGQTILNDEPYLDKSQPLGTNYTKDGQKYVNSHGTTFKINPDGSLKDVNTGKTIPSLDKTK